MTSDSDRFVAKVHPASRPVEPEDPLAMHAISLEGDPEVMLECLVQEYAWMGWSAYEILALFEDPEYPALAELYRHFGEAGLRQRVAQCIGTAGVFQVRVMESDNVESEDPESELLELGVLAPRRGGNDHA
jgi:hypothetical protein